MQRLRYKHSYETCVLHKHTCLIIVVQPSHTSSSVHRMWLASASCSATSPNPKHPKTGTWGLHKHGDISWYICFVHWKCTWTRGRTEGFVWTRPKMTEGFQVHAMICKGTTSMNKQIIRSFFCTKKPPDIGRRSLPNLLCKLPEIRTPSLWCFPGVENCLVGLQMAQQ